MPDKTAPALPVVFLMGPTGVGKTRLALTLAAAGDAEIISVDSALVYRGLNIGSAKPTPAEQQRVPHHLLDLCDPAETYSAAQFRHDAIAAISAVHARGRLPLLVGGTGLYFRALEQGLSVLPDADPAVRAALRAELERDGAAVLHARLAAVDPVAAARIHPNDPQRIVRALEVYRVGGRPMSAYWAQPPLAPLALPLTKIALAPTQRTQLHERLNRRFDGMLERGLINEVRVLRTRPELSPQLPALRTVGYREVWRYLDGELGFDAMRTRAATATRQLAKRQLTWLRREADCQWLDSDARDLVAQARQLLPAMSC